MDDPIGLREQVCRANVELAGSGLVMGTFGNVSGVDRAKGVLVIKPSGVPYTELTPAHMVSVSLATGEVVAGTFRPSSDTPTHLELYRAFPGCGGIVHTHSEYATVFAQAREPVRCMGTTHADYFHGDVPVTRPAVSHHVRVLKDAGLVREEDGLLVAVVDPLPALRTYFDRLWFEASVGEGWLRERFAVSRRLYALPREPVARKRTA